MTLSDNTSYSLLKSINSEIFYRKKLSIIFDTFKVDNLKTIRNISFQTEYLNQFNLFRLKKKAIIILKRFSCHCKKHFWKTATATRIHIWWYMFQSNYRNKIIKCMLIINNSLLKSSVLPRFKTKENKTDGIQIILMNFTMH